ncbi:MAG: OsmC family protein [Gammaproteobacteria bacterium]
MSEHHARVSWTAGEAGFRRGRFTRVHRWTFDGGLEVAASASPAVIPAPWSDAAAVDPEEAFVAAVASCHMMSFLFLANRAGLDVVDYDDEASGMLAADAEGRYAITEVVLRPRVTFAAGQAPDDDQLAGLHHEAHDTCYIANSVRTAIRVAPRDATD